MRYPQMLFAEPIDDFKRIKMRKKQNETIDQRIQGVCL
jgi:hypothetical protein